MSKVGMIAHVHPNKSSLAYSLARLIEMGNIKETTMRDVIVKEGLKHGITEAASDKVVDSLEAQGYTLSKKPPEAAVKAVQAAEKSQLKVQPAQTPADKK